MDKKSIRYKLGVGIVIFGFVCPIIGLITPLIDLNISDKTRAALITFFTIGGPEIFLILGGILAGKEGVIVVKNSVKKFLGIPEKKYPASKTQYNIGIGLIFLWFLMAILPGYIPKIIDAPFIRENILWLSIAADIMFIIAIFGFGGHQMITKLAAVLKWEPWELPQEEKQKHF